MMAVVDFGHQKSHPVSSITTWVHPLPCITQMQFISQLLIKSIIVAFCVLTSASEHTTSGESNVVHGERRFAYRFGRLNKGALVSFLRHQICEYGTF